MRRATIGALNLSVIDDDDSNTRYLHDEMFGSRIYHHGKLRIPKGATVMDVGANVGLYTIWAQRQYQPQAIYCYEASPRTFAYLQDNIQRLVDPKATKAMAFNSAMASTAGKKRVLHQSTKVSAISTLLEKSKADWIGKTSAAGELVTCEVMTSTISAEIEANRLAAVDVFKIDVEGYFLEVLKGIAPNDFRKIKNIVAEVDYLLETGIKPEDFENMLKTAGYETDCLDRSLQNNLTFYAWRA